MQAISAKPRSGKQEIDEPDKCKGKFLDKGVGCPWLKDPAKPNLTCTWRLKDGTFDFGPNVRTAYCPIAENTRLFNEPLKRAASELSAAFAEGKDATQLFKILEHSEVDWRWLDDVVLEFCGKHKDNVVAMELLTTCRNKGLLDHKRLRETFPELFEQETEIP